MFEDKVLNKSFPKDRVIMTRQANPSLASQAAKVNTTKVINSSFVELNSTIIRVIVSITASRASKAIKRCRRCVIIVVIAKDVVKKIEDEIDKSIVCREISQPSVYKTDAMF